MTLTLIEAAEAVLRSSFCERYRLISPFKELQAEVDAARLKLPKPREPDEGGIEVGTGRHVPPHGTAARYAMDAEID